MHETCASVIVASQRQSVAWNLSMSTDQRFYVYHGQSRRQRGSSSARPPHLRYVCPPFHVWSPGCSIHPILYLKMCPSCDFSPPLLRNPGDGPGLAMVLLESLGILPWCLKLTDFIIQCDVHKRYCCVTKVLLITDKASVVIGLNHVINRQFHANYAKITFRQKIAILATRQTTYKKRWKMHKKSIILSADYYVYELKLCVAAK